jgi:hypothetical protein
MDVAVRGRRAQLVAGWILSSLVAESVAVTFAFATLATDLRGVLAAAVIEGGLLGLSQRWLLRAFVRPGFERGWVLATLAGAVLGRVVEYQADMIAALTAITRWSQPTQYGAGVALGFAVGALMAAPQAFTLRDRVRGAWRWVLARGLAWAFALPLIGVASALVVGSLAGSTFGMLGVIAVAAALAGAIEGLAIVILVAE